MVSTRAELIQDRSIWDKFIEESKESTIFHKWELLQIVERHTGYQALPYGVFQGDELIAVFPVFYRKDLMFRMVTTYPPQSGIPYLGPIMFNSAKDMKPSTREKCFHRIVETVITEINKLAPNYTYIQMMPGQYDIRPFKWLDFQEESNFTYFIDLHRSPEEILASFDKDARRLIRDAGKNGLELRQSPDVDTFFGIMQKRYAEQGLALPILSPQYVRELLETFPDHLRMYSLYKGEDIVSIVIVTIFHGRMTYWMGNPRIDSGISGNEYMIWEAIQQAKAEGCTEFEINGAGERRLHQFKSKFNPRLEVCYVVNKKDGLGSMAEWVYANFMKRIWA